ncbi:MAG TPA: hypothetical protein VKR06_35100 [Ktedonosporobacter sp.]|nr:hypothetical protein [Ktedonosporobacter sp.]
MMTFSDQPPAPEDIDRAGRTLRVPLDTPPIILSILKAHGAEEGATVPDMSYEQSFLSGRHYPYELKDGKVPGYLAIILPVGTKQMFRNLRSAYYQETVTTFPDGYVVYVRNNRAFDLVYPPELTEKDLSP